METSTLTPSFSCSAILFDLDGVLVDSTRAVDRVWRKWALANNLNPDEVVSVAHGRRTIETVRQVAPHLNDELEMRKIERWEVEDTDGVVVMPGAADLLQAILDGRWCVVTSGTRLLATTRLRVGNLPTPRVLVSADDVTNGKPDPEPYLKGAKLLGVKPEDCLVIEDAPAGVRAAHAAKMKVIAITSTFPESELKEADAVIRFLNQIRVARNQAADQKLSVQVR
jgi:sugar-phosphatase